MIKTEISIQLGMIPTRVEYDKLYSEIKDKISKFEVQIANSSEIIRRYDEVLCEKASKASLQSFGFKIE